jgi:hydroxylamine reductase (hybrid-cluster protein)
VLSFLIDGDSTQRHDLETNLGWALKVGEYNLKGMSLLDKGHRKRFGVPTPTQVMTSPVPGKVNQTISHFESTCHCCMVILS